MAGQTTFSATRAPARPVALSGGGSQPRTPPPGKKLARFRYDRESRVDRLMEGGFDRRVRAFRDTGQAMELTELPDVLDELLELNSTELEEVLELMGLDANELRHEDGSMLGRITPDYVVQLLGGNRHGTFNLLPTTEKRASEALEQISKRLVRMDEGPEKERLEKTRVELRSVRDRLKAVPRVSGWKELGLTASLMISVGKENPLDTRTGAQRIKGWAGKVLGHGSSLGLGVGVSRVDRHTGKREMVPYAQLSSDMVLGGVNYTIKRDERSLDFMFHPGFVTIGNDPVCGRHIYFAPPLGISFTIGERFLGVGIPKSLFAGGHPMLRSKYLDADPILLLGIRGDPIQALTGSTIRKAFKAYRAFRRALGIPENKKKASPGLEVGEVEADGGGGSSDWLTSPATIST